MGVSGKWLRTSRAAWTAVVLYVVILYSTLTVLYDIYVTVFARLGRDQMSFLINVFLGLSGTLVAASFIRRAANRTRALVALGLIGLWLALSLVYLEVPAKRLHYLEYAPLTLLLLHAIRFHCRERSAYLWTLGAVFLVGLGDESIQWLLPQRHFGLIDLFVNTSAGLLTLAFVAFVVGEPETAHRDHRGLTEGTEGVGREGVR